VANRAHASSRKRKPLKRITAFASLKTVPAQWHIMNRFLGRDGFNLKTAVQTTAARRAQQKASVFQYDDYGALKEDAWLCWVHVLFAHRAS